MLADAGLKTIEATAFVSPSGCRRWRIMRRCCARCPAREGVSYPVLVPNLKGFEAALAAGATEVAVFAAASETFSQKNINCSIAESLERFAPVFAAARAANIRVRGYVSCALGCPYEGAVDPERVAEVAGMLFDAAATKFRWATPSAWARRTTPKK